MNQKPSKASFTIDGYEISVTKPVNSYVVKGTIKGIEFTKNFTDWDDAVKFVAALDDWLRVYKDAANIHDDEIRKLNDKINALRSKADKERKRAELDFRIKIEEYK